MNLIFTARKKFHFQENVRIAVTKEDLICVLRADSGIVLACVQKRAILIEKGNAK